MITGKSSLPSEKTLELILYIASKLKEKPNYGSTLLNKALYHIDGMNYLINGSPISEFQYVRQGNGPTPKPSQFLAARDYLENKGRLNKVENQYYVYIQKKYITNEIPNLEFFSKEEIDVINDVLLNIGELSAFDASEKTHKSICWKLAKQMEILPLSTYLLGSEEPSSSDYDWAENSISNLSLSVN